MSDTIRHRGPDDSGIWTDDSDRCGFGFRRLSILDLSPNGHQPMTSPTGRFTVMFNGEIYNHLDIRRELEQSGVPFRGHSDTETLCAAFERWGIRDTVKRCIGMFAMAIWDCETRALSLVRDRLGIKPLYVYEAPGLLLFASEIKALKAHTAFSSSMDARAVELFFRYLYIPAPLSIYQNVRKLLPGHITTIAVSDFKAHSQAYWSVEEAYREGLSNPFSGSEEEGVEALEALLFDAVQIRKLSDVPIGALLSGGIDSSTVVAMMQKGASEPARTFSIGFSSADHDESVHAAAIARHLGTQHTSMMLSGSESMSVLPELPHIFDEPFADPSQIPTLLVCRMARNDVTVALTGDGGDELFGGYHRYIDGNKVIQRGMQLPRGARRLGAFAAHKLASNGSFVTAALMKSRGQRLGQQKLMKLATVLAGKSEEEMYLSLLSAWQDPGDVTSSSSMTVPGGDPVRDALYGTGRRQLLDRMMLVDQRTYLPDELLAKVDRASMAVSLEARVPLLDHRVVEFAWRLPATWKIRGRTGKWILREVLYRHVPRELVDRPKVGFTVPIEDWLRGPLRAWAHDALQNSSEPIDRNAVLKVWERFQRGEPGHGLKLWAVVMFEAWRKAWANG